MEWLCAAVALEFGISDELYYVVGLLSACSLPAVLPFLLSKLYTPRRAGGNFTTRYYNFILGFFHKAVLRNSSTKGSLSTRNLM